MLEQAQRLADKISLHGGIVGLATWIAQGEVDEQEAGDSAIFNDVSSASNHNGGNVN